MGPKDWARGVGPEEGDGGDGEDGGWVLFNDFAIAPQTDRDVVSFQTCGTRTHAHTHALMHARAHGRTRSGFGVSVRFESLGRGPVARSWRARLLPCAARGGL